MEIKLDENNDYIKIDNKDQIKIVGTFQKPYFCVEDACRVFGSSNIDKVGLNQIKLLSEFDENECDLGRTHLRNLPGAVFYINILGLFHLAESDAIFEDIFPAIRERENQDLLKQIKSIHNAVNLLADLMSQ